MKITDVTTEGYSWPRTRPIRNGKYTYTTAGLALTRVQTDEGLTGIGLGGVNRGLLERFKPLLVGEDPFNVDRLRDRRGSAPRVSHGLRQPRRASRPPAARSPARS